MAKLTEYKTDLSIPEHRAHADKALFAFKEVADGLGLTWCLFAGTALGLWRDRKYLPGDNDIDVAVVEDMGTLWEALDDAGFALGRFCENEDGTMNRHTYYKDGERHPTKDGILVDIFYTFTEEEEQFLYAFDAVVYRDDLLPLPGPIQSYLLTAYHNWSDPDERDSAKGKKGVAVGA